MSGKGAGERRAAAASQPPEQGKILQMEREEMRESHKHEHLRVK